MNRNSASRMFEEAKHYCEENYPNELEWANGINAETFRTLRSKRFLTEYCWVIYASGFKVSTVEVIFSDLNLRLFSFRV